MAQVLLPPSQPKTSLADVFTRALQGYEAYTAGRKNSAEQDALEQKTANDAAEEQRNQLGVITPKEQAAMASSGKFKEFGVVTPETPAPAGSYIHRVSDRPDVEQFAIPVKEGITLPVKFETRRGADGKNYISKVDPTTGSIIESPNDALAANQPKDTTESDKTKGEKNYLAAITGLQSGKADPAYQQAEKDIYSANKLDSLVKQAGGDLNNLNPQQGKLFLQELGKMATGGVPTQEELKNLEPGTFEAKWAVAKQKVFNEPTPANLGAFYNQYKDYINGIAQDANNYIQQRNQPLLDAYQPLLDQKGYNNLKTQYVDKYQANVDKLNAQLAPKQQAPQSGSGTAQAATPIQVGHKENGYTFLGGNPGDPKAWRKE